MFILRVIPLFLIFLSFAALAAISAFKPLLNEHFLYPYPLKFARQYQQHQEQQRNQLLQTSLSQLELKEKTLESLLEAYKRTKNENYKKRFVFLLKKYEAQKHLSTQVQLILADWWQYQHRFSLAEKALQKLIKKNPDWIRPRSLLTGIYLSWKKPQKALVFAEDLVRRIPTSGAYLLRARSHAQLGQLAQASRDFQEALKREDVNQYKHAVWLRYSIGRFLDKHGQLKKAQEAFMQAKKIDPENHFFQ